MSFKPRSVYRVKSTASPIQKLSPEILSHIISLAVDANNLTRLKSPKFIRKQHDGPVYTSAKSKASLISRVCRLWRNVALSTPQVWATLFISLSTWIKYPSPQIIEDHISRHVKRSRSVPLTITFQIHSFEADDEKQVLHYLTSSNLFLHRDRILYLTLDLHPKQYLYSKSVLELVSNEFSAIRSLDIFTYSDSLVPERLLRTFSRSRLKEGQLPNLHIVRVLGQDTKYPFKTLGFTVHHDRVTHTSLGARSPNRVVRTSAWSRSPSHLKTLVSLELGLHSGWASWARFSLEAVYEKDGEARRTTTSLLPSLRELTITYNTKKRKAATFEEIAIILDWFLMPVLDSLTLIQTGKFNNVYFKDDDCRRQLLDSLNIFLTRSAHPNLLPLTTFRMEGIPFSDTDLMQVLTLMPELTTLVLRDVDVLCHASLGARVMDYVRHVERGMVTQKLLKTLTLYSDYQVPRSIPEPLVPRLKSFEASLDSPAVWKSGVFETMVESRSDILRVVSPRVGSSRKLKVNWGRLQALQRETRVAIKVVQQKGEGRLKELIGYSVA
ncbi:hypothetical protein WG66_009467 [Moniliophthora roreri]|uniref:Uncharacterized protein n=1 Tax=Moniliophthora roreri TaxID=221103 RepID=A0A0W0F9S5_MONRR|nr:hypothetical protein WG66_009467 [Moniliophthora roreri]